MYQLGFDFHAVPSTFASNRSGFGAPWVAQTSFCSCSERSPQKYYPIGDTYYQPDSNKWGVPIPERRNVCSEPVDYFDGEE